MTSENSYFIDEADVNLFDIACHSRYLVRQRELASRRYQECVLSRNESAIVAVTHHDFVGNDFNLEINLVNRTIELTSESMDVAWAEELLKVVYAKVVDLLSMETCGFEYVLFRQREPIANNG